MKRIASATANAFAGGGEKTSPEDNCKATAKQFDEVNRQA
jgi:hypothetical protein